MASYLNKEGLTYLWGRIKNYVHITVVGNTKTLTVGNTSLDLQSPATTLSGYGITDASINTSTGAITLGSNTITPLTSGNVGVANGVCPLDNNSKIDSQYLPSYVDDVIEAYAKTGETALSSTWLATGSASGTSITPETGKIYVLMADYTENVGGTTTVVYAANTQFRWGGTTYVKLNDGGVTAITNAEIDVIVAS